MPKHIGILACSAEGAALCYRTICTEAPKHFGDEYSHPEITLHSLNYSDYVRLGDVEDWSSIAELMLTSIQVLTVAGVDFVICPDNGIHRAYDLLVEKSDLPFLNIVEEVAKEAEIAGYKKLGVLGTRILMEGPLYQDTFAKYNLHAEVPTKSQRAEVDRIVFSELVRGVVSTSSRKIISELITQFKENDCDAVVLGCTELPLLFESGEEVLPLLDSTRILARSAIAFSLSKSDKQLER